jgi:hypothetical protein
MWFPFRILASQKSAMRFAIFPTTALALLTGPLLAQQELYVLGRFEKIWRVDGYDTATPNPVEVTTWQQTVQHDPVGLAFDPDTGTFLVLTSPWGQGNNLTSHLSRVDPMSGTTTVLCSFPFGGLRGLERRWDGTLFTVRDNVGLVRLDPATCDLEVIPLTSAIGSTWSPVALDERGDIWSEDGPLLRVDPIDGSVSQTPIPAPPSAVLGLEVDLGGVVYTCGISADVWRFDPLVGSWVEVLPSWNVLNNTYDVAFKQATDGRDLEDICAGLPNSTGVGSTLEPIGTGLISANDLELNSRRLPPQVFGYYLMGANQGSTPVGHGVLCIAAPVHRYSSSVLSSGVDGQMRFSLDLNQLASGAAAQPGDRFLFQLWHRDNVAGSPTSNFSSTVAVTFH